MQHLCTRPEGTTISGWCMCMSNPGKFLCVLILRPYSPGGPLNVFTLARKGSIPPTPGGHRLRLGLPGYLIPFAPLAFAPQRQSLASTLPSLSVFLRISTHFTTPPGIPCPSLALKSARLSTTRRVKPPAVTPNVSDRLHALYAQ